MRHVLWRIGVLLGCVAACGGKSASPNPSSPSQGGDAAGAVGSDAGAPQGGTGAVTSQAGAAGAEEAGSSATGGSGAGGMGGAEPSGEGGAGGTPATCSACGALETCGDQALCTAKLVPLPEGFAIDATEVTRRQYAAWLATAPSPSGQEAACAWNDSFEPDSACLASAEACQGEACAQHPQVCVDFCDAAAYCRAVGKRLCGAIGGGPVSGTPSFEQSEWLDACTSHGQNTYAYGNSLQFGRCNDGTRSAPTTDPVASNSECQSSYVAYRGVFDLNGNVWEWENNCHSSMGASDVCNPRGTSFGVSAAAPLCSATLPVTRGGALKNVGFRCCSG